MSKPVVTYSRKKTINNSSNDISSYLTSGSVNNTNFSANSNCAIDDVKSKVNPLEDRPINRSFFRDENNLEEYDSYGVVKQNKRNIDLPEKTNNNAKKSKSNFSSSEGSQPKKNFNQQIKNSKRQEIMSILESSHHDDLRFLYTSLNGGNLTSGRFTFKAPNWKSEDANRLNCWLESLGFTYDYLSFQKVYCLSLDRVDLIRRDINNFVKSSQLENFGNTDRNLLEESSMSVQKNMVS